MTNVLAYRLTWDTTWEPGMPKSGEADYWEKRRKGDRAQCRDDNMADAWLDYAAFPGSWYDIDFALEPRPGDEVFYMIGRTQNGTVPNPLIFKCDVYFLDFLDYPYNDQMWEIMSEEMLHTLVNVRAFAHRTYPTRMEAAECIDIDEIPESPSHAFYVVQTLEYLDAFDFDKSEYVLDPELEGYVDSATKVVLKEPANGFPPLFRLKAQNSPLFVSVEAKAALEAAGTARGVEFIPVDEYYHW